MQRFYTPPVALCLEIRTRSLYIALYFIVMLKNNAIVGFILGLIGPIIGLIIMKFIWFRADPMGSYVHMLVHTHDTMFRIFSLSLLINLIPFIFFNSRRHDNSARGVFIATLLYVVFIVLVRYVW